MKWYTSKWWIFALSNRQMTHSVVDEDGTWTKCVGSLFVLTDPR